MSTRALKLSTGWQNQLYMDSAAPPPFVNIYEITDGKLYTLNEKRKETPVKIRTITKRIDKIKPQCYSKEKIS